MIKSEIRKYSNGLTHVHYYLPFLKRVTASLVVKVGAADESSEDLYGITHFIEHMVFNGTKDFPDIGMVENECRKNGIFINAWTNSSFTNYYINSPSEGIEHGLKILFNMSFDPIFAPDACEKEKGIVIEEIKMINDQPASALYQKLMDVGFNGTGYGHTVLGYESSVSNFTPELLHQYHQRFYIPGNSMLITYGGLKLGDVQKFIDPWADALSRKDIPARQPIGQTLGLGSKKESIIVKRDVETSLYMSIVELQRIKDLDQYVSYLILQSYLADGRASILTNELIVKNSLASYVFFEYFMLGDRITIFLECAMSEANKEKVKKSYLENINKILEGGFDPASFKRAHNYLHGSLIREIEDSYFPTSSDISNLPLVNFNFGLNLEIDEVIKRVSTISSDEVHDIIKKSIDLTKSIDGNVIKSKVKFKK